MSIVKTTSNPFIEHPSTYNDNPSTYNDFSKTGMNKIQDGISEEKFTTQPSEQKSIIDVIISPKGKESKAASTCRIIENPISTDCTARVIAKCDASDTKGSVSPPGESNLSRKPTKYTTSKDEQLYKGVVPKYIQQPIQQKTQVYTNVDPQKSLGKQDITFKEKLLSEGGPGEGGYVSAGSVKEIVDLQSLYKYLQHKALYTLKNINISELKRGIVVYVVVLVWIAVYSKYMDQLGQPMDATVFTIGGRAFCFWPVSHFLMYVVLGILAPSCWAIWTTLGIMHEVMEYTIGYFLYHHTEHTNIKSLSRAVNGKDATHTPVEHKDRIKDVKSQYDEDEWVTSDWRDIIFNSAGLYVGMYIHKMYKSRHHTLES